MAADILPVGPCCKVFWNWLVAVIYAYIHVYIYIFHGTVTPIDSIVATATAVSQRSMVKAAKAVWSMVKVHSEVQSIAVEWLSTCNK